MDMIKVSANSRTSAVAGAIAGVIREHKRAEVQAIGAGAVNQPCAAGTKSERQRGWRGGNPARLVKHIVCQGSKSATGTIVGGR